jgi:predicted phage tail protein
MSSFTKVRLHGDLGAEVGPEWELDVSTVGEAMKAIEYLSRRKLFKHLISKDKQNLKYQVLINEKLVTYENGEINEENLSDVEKSELVMRFEKLDTIDVVPVLQGAGCLLGGTKISMADGSSKDIENVIAGDMVMAYNEANGVLEESEVSKTFEHSDTEGYLIINNQIKLTDNHPVYVMSRGCVSAGELKIGDILMREDGSEESIESISAHGELVTTFNIEVEKHHNYFADGYLVHNKGLLGIILGAALIFAAFIPGLNVFVAVALFTAGAGLLAAGIMTMLAKPPVMDPPKDIEIKGATSYLFSNIVNTNKEGNPVPICYGRLRIGSYVLESTYDSYNVIAHETPSNSEQISTIDASVTVINPADEILHEV